MKMKVFFTQEKTMKKSFLERKKDIEAKLDEWAKEKNDIDDAMAAATKDFLESWMKKNDIQDEMKQLLEEIRKVNSDCDCCCPCKSEKEDE